MSNLYLLLDLLQASHTFIILLYVIASIPIVWTDIRWMIIPDIIIIPATALFLMLRVIVFDHALLEIAASAAIVLAAASIVYVAAHGGIGWGDVKLLTMTAIAFGATFTAAAVVAAVLLSASFATALLVIGKAHRHTRIPWAPFITSGAISLQLLVVIVHST